MVDEYLTCTLPFGGAFVSDLGTRKLVRMNWRVQRRMKKEQPKAHTSTPWTRLSSSLLSLSLDANREVANSRKAGLHALPMEHCRQLGRHY